MKKIVPYKKELEFNTEVSEITSISLENTLKKASDNYITGDFIISGEYKIVDVSLNTEKFSFELPFDIDIDKKYKTDNLVIDIDDFYYELDKNKMIVNISVLLDNLEEIEIIESKQEDVREEVEEKSKDEVNIKEERDNSMKDVFDSFDVEESYRTYKVYIVRENDNLESILERFDVTKEDLENYNDLNSITVGLKLIIPTNNNEKL